MLRDLPVFTTTPERQAIRLSSTLRENEVLAELRRIAAVPAAAAANIRQDARELVNRIRYHQAGAGGLDVLLQEFSLSSEEGIALMCLAEALLRIPDSNTQGRMIREQINAGDWATHLGHSDSLFVNASAWGLLLTGKVTHLSDDQNQSLLTTAIVRLGEPVIRTAMRQAMQIMGNQFVMGSNIRSAVSRARKWQAMGYTYSYDMLGEGARTREDADAFFADYLEAISFLGQQQSTGAGISVKLSALHPRYEMRQHDRVMAELVPKLLELAVAAKDVDIGFTVDAEESFRLDLCLEVVTTVLQRGDFSGWEGFGMAVQAYQKTGLQVVDWVSALAESSRQRLCVRLVKGAYWDSEIKWAQERGFEDYPVFTQKHATDISYQACARRLLESRRFIYPQFATHNAYTVAAIRHYESVSGVIGGFEFQRLHGMGEELYDELVAQGTRCRIYAPVGEHEELLAYLVRRLLENGANTSFVNNIQNRGVPVDQLIENPLEQSPTSDQLPLPGEVFHPRINSRGFDLSSLPVMAVLQSGLERVDKPAPGAGYEVINPATEAILGHIRFDDEQAMLEKLTRVVAGQGRWASTTFAYRAELLRKLANDIEENRADYLALCITEAGKTLSDAIAEVREAVDFCRYYADESEKLQGEPIGTLLCISPWNFPLAIFLGQVSAALVTGNTVLAKPAEQTSLIAQRLVSAMYHCGIPEDALQLTIADGALAGQYLVTSRGVDGVMFTGSDRTAREIAGLLNDRREGEITLIAETGGLNAMIVDSTALAEQVVDDVIVSAFESAGQRCSSLRVLYLQNEVADTMINKIIGRMKEIRVGDPASCLTDVGPIIDRDALDRLKRHVRMLESKHARLLYQPDINLKVGYYFPPSLYELPEAMMLREEAFGPILHVKRFNGNRLESVIDEINASGFGLTCGIHSRIDSRCVDIAKLLKVGNIYINRNMVGAVVGAQPFGGMGRSGTGPKAGGAAYLPRLLGKRRITASTGTLPAYQPTHEDVFLLPSLKHWQSRNVTERVDRIHQLLGELVAFGQLSGDDSVFKKFESVTRWVRSNEGAVRLPAITGESNKLTWMPRGLLGLYMTSLTEEQLLLMATSLVTGNGLLVSGETAWLEAINTRDLVIERSDSLRLGPNGVVVSARCEWVHELRAVLLDVHSALVPVLSDWASPWRFMAEKTVTTNTAATGGNASLMAGTGNRR